MLTPQEVSEKRFKQAVFGGYDMPAVDEFLESLTADYGKLYQENVVLKNKMKVLVDKLEEYRGNEDNLRKAYLAIRAQAEKELADAKQERETIVATARQEAGQYTGDLEDQIARETKRLNVMRTQTATFISLLKDCYRKQADQLDLILTASMDDSPKDKHDAQVLETADVIGQSLSLILEDAPVLTPEVKEPSKPEKQPLPESVAPDLNLDVLKQKIREDATYNESEEVDWTPEDSSAVPRPKFEFPSLEDNFGGHSALQKHKR
jgi:cell division initiation protein